MIARHRLAALAAAAAIAVAIAVAIVVRPSGPVPGRAPDSPPATAERAPHAESAHVLASPRRDATPVAPPSTAMSGETIVATFLDGRPIATLLRDVAAHRPADWNAATSRHPLPAEGDRFAVVARECRIVVVSRDDLPQHGERRVDLVRAPVLDVRLVNVPPTLRERLRLSLQLDYGELSREDNTASILAGRGPFDLAEDRVLVPLVLPLPGRLQVHATSRHSTHSYPTPTVAFEPVSQVVELDLAVLAPACSLANLTLTLRFPHGYPAGMLDLSLVDGAGSAMMSQRRRRGTEAELEYTFRDLPPARVHPVLRFSVVGAAPPIHVTAVDLVAGHDVAVRDVVAESSLHVTLTGREGLAENGVIVGLCLPNGDGIVANWPRDSDTRFEHLTATTVYAQAVAHHGRRCSRIVRVDLGVAQAHQLALQLVPGGQVEVPAGAFGASVRELAVQYAGEAPYHVGIRPQRNTTFWLPLGQPRVDWADGSRALRVEPGVLNRWP